MERGEVIAPWRWTDNPQGWVECSKLYTRFIEYVSRYPDYVYVDDDQVHPQRIQEVDIFMELICESILDNFEMLSGGAHDAFCHPETILTKTAFGPAYCDGFTMHQRYILLLKTM